MSFKPTLAICGANVCAGRTAVAGPALPLEPPERAEPRSGRSEGMCPPGIGSCEGKLCVFVLIELPFFLFPPEPDSTATSRRAGRDRASDARGNHRQKPAAQLCLARRAVGRKSPACG